jgi:hypothetical protein
MGQTQNGIPFIYYRARRDLPVFFLRTGTARSGGFFGIGGSFGFAAFALNESNNSCLRSDWV